jgi:putative FmdB family regulatory protein
MPLYDFICRTCGTAFEALVRPPQTTASCPSCQGQDLERQISSFAVSSSERREASAAKSRKSQFKEGLQKNLALQREAERHRKEDH